MPVMLSTYNGHKPEGFRILLELENIKNSRNIETYCGHKGYEAFSTVLKTPLSPDNVIETIKKSGLRGRGGAGFPTGLKWSFVPKDPGEKYLVTNFDEGEPGTFKDCYIAKISPHMLIEGKLIAAYAIGAQKSYIYIRGEFYDEIAYMEKAIEEAYDKGFLGENILGSGFTHHMDIYVGAGAYICGEETGLISSLEGKKGQPKLKPPFPAIKGYLNKPTVVNNVETLAAVPWIMRHGPDAYKAFGTEKSSGTKLFNVSGPVKKPGCFELPLGYPLMRLINEDCGGLKDGLELKAVIPGGSSAPILTKEECQDLLLDYESIAQKGSMLGSGAIIVIPNTVKIPELLENIMDFYAHESCGQCTPCREGTGWLFKTSKTILEKSAKKDDLKRMYDIAKHMRGGRTICVLSDAAADPALAIIDKFSQEFESYFK